jgi:hypothetical protein
MKARIADRIVERTGMERDIFVRDSEAFGRELDRIASARGMTREDVALELYWYHYTADALEAACGEGLVGNPKDFILALEDALSL